MKGYTEKNLEDARMLAVELDARDSYVEFCEMMADATEAELEDRQEYLRDLEMRGWSR